MSENVLSLLRRVSVALVMVGLATDAVASPQAIARFKDWAVFTNEVGDDRICYAVTEATDKAPVGEDHGEVWFYVTSWRSGRAKGQPSLKVGYDLRPDLSPSARVGRTKWTLFSAGNEAFARDEDDTKLVRAIKRGSELRIEAVSSADTQVAYHFSLAGSTAAIDRAAAICRR